MVRGFYWLKLPGHKNWTIGEWHEVYAAFYLCGSDRPFCREDIEIIGPRILDHHTHVDQELFGLNQPEPEEY